MNVSLEFLQCLWSSLQTGIVLSFLVASFFPGMGIGFEILEGMNIKELFQCFLFFIIVFAIYVFMCFIFSLLFCLL